MGSRLHAGRPRTGGLRRWGATATLVGAVIGSTSCLTRSGFERRAAELRCAIDNACERRTCDALAHSSEPLDHELHGLTCPAKPSACHDPDAGGWYDEGLPSSDCYTFHRPAAEQCLADLERSLEASATAPLTRELFCWPTPPSCDAVYTKIEWPECPLVR